jgi:hypothetical protein
MFQGRVDGVGSQRARADGDVTFEKELSLTEIVNRIKIGSNFTPGTGVVGPDMAPDPVPVAKSSALPPAAKSSALPLPLILGAAYLLLS